MSNVADKLANKTPRRQAKQVRLKLVYLNLRSSMMVSVLIGLVLGVLAIIVTMLAWAILTGTGAVDQLDSLISGSTVSGGGISAKSFLSFSHVFGFAAILGLINVIVVTVLGMICALMYNLIVKMTGGLFLGFTNS